MGKAICKLDGMYFLWSSIVDAPTTYGLTKNELREFVIEEAAKKAAQWFDHEVDGLRNGETSYWGAYDVESLVKFNRIGDFGDNPTVTTVDDLRTYLLNKRDAGEFNE